MVRETSLKAWLELSEDTVSHSQTAILRTLREEGACTDRELARYLGYVDPNKVRPRRCELYKMGKVWCTGKRECMVSHKTAMQWEVK